MLSHTTPRWLLLSTVFVALAAGACGGAASDMSALTAPADTAEDGTKTPVPAAAPIELRGEPVAEEAPIKKFIGTYRWVGGVPEQRVLWQRIQSIANTFNFIAKGIVRDKLAAGNVIAKEIRIEADADTLVIYRDKTNVTASLDGTSTKVKSSTGEMMDMSFKVEGNEIVQTSTGINKGRVNRYELKDGKLIVHTRVHSTQLPKELLYEMTYERVETPEP
jgi:hypothetical protein